MIFRRVLCLTVFVLLSGVTWAAGFGSVRGVVHDPQHRPLPGAQVLIRGRDSAGTKTVQANANGEFQLNDLPEGTYHGHGLRAGFPAARTAGDRDRREGAGSAFPTRTRGSQARASKSRAPPAS